MNGIHRAVRGTWRVSSLVAFLLVIAGPLLASGSYRPPTSTRTFSAGSSRRDVERGQALFTGKEPLGTSGRSCLSCHDTGSSSPMRRSSLKDHASQLAELIERCILHADRCAVARQPSSNALTSTLVAYLVAKYSLPRDAVSRSAPKP